MGRAYSFPTAARRAPRPGTAGPVLAYDREWRGRLHTAAVSAFAALAVALATDAAVGTLDLVRGLLWTAMAAALFAVLLPPRTTAGAGWLTVRGLLTERRVRTDYLVSARFEGTIARHLILCDAFGTHAEVDPDVLSANPFLWHRLDTGAHHSHAAGLLPDMTALRELRAAIDTTTARDLLTTAGLD